MSEYYNCTICRNYPCSCGAYKYQSVTNEKQYTDQLGEIRIEELKKQLATQKEVIEKLMEGYKDALESIHIEYCGKEECPDLKYHFEQDEILAYAREKLGPDSNELQEKGRD